MTELKPEQKRLVILLVVLLAALIWAGFKYFGAGGLADRSDARSKVEWRPHSFPVLVGAPEDIPVAEGVDGERNPFLYGPRPTPTPNLTPPPTQPPRPTRPPPPTRPPATPTPPGWKPPPPFDMEYIGHFGPEGKRVAVFREKVGGFVEIAVAREGGVLEDLFIVRELGLESVLIGYVGFPETEKKRVPLANK